MSSTAMIPSESCSLVHTTSREDSLPSGGDKKILTGRSHSKSGSHDTKKDEGHNSNETNDTISENGICNGSTGFNLATALPTYTTPCTDWTEKEDSRPPEVSTSPDRPTLKSREAICAALEREHVHNVYHQMSHHFQDVRFKAWPKVKQFLHDLEPGSIVADIGCGNGKYLHINKKIVKIGSDQCHPLVEIARGHNHEAMVADNLKLPYRDNCFDAVISIAVIHHFTTTGRRAQAIRELARILRPGGKLMVYVWAMEQKHRKFKSQDVLVPWHFKAKHPKREKSKTSSDCTQSQSNPPGDTINLQVHKTSKQKKDKLDTTLAAANHSSKPSSQNGHKKEMSIPDLIKSRLLKLIGSKDSDSEAEKPESQEDEKPSQIFDDHLSVGDIMKEQEALFKIPRPLLEHSLSVSEIEGFAVREFPMSSRPPIVKQASLDFPLYDSQSCDPLLPSGPPSQIHCQGNGFTKDNRNLHKQTGSDLCSFRRNSIGHPFGKAPDLQKDSNSEFQANIISQTTDCSSSPNNNKSDEEHLASPVDLPPRSYHKHCGSEHCSKPATCPSSPIPSGNSGKKIVRRLNSQSPKRAPKGGFGVLSDSENDEDWMRNTRRAIQTMQNQVDSLGQPLHKVVKCCSFHEHRPQVLLPTDLSSPGAVLKAKDSSKVTECAKPNSKETTKATKHKFRDFLKITDIFKVSEHKVNEAKIVTNGRSGTKLRKRIYSDTSSISSVSSVSSLSSMSSDTDISDVEDIGNVCNLCGNIASNIATETGAIGSIEEIGCGNSINYSSNPSRSPPEQSLTLLDTKDSTPNTSLSNPSNSDLQGPVSITQSVRPALLTDRTATTRDSNTTTTNDTGIGREEEVKGESTNVMCEGVKRDGEDKDSTKRFYHVFKEEELVDLIKKNVESLHVLDSYYDHANWCVVCEKVNVWTL